MRLNIETRLEQPIAVVWSAFHNADNLKRWQPTLESLEHVSGTPGEVGSVSRLTYKEGNQSVVLTETITAIKEPDLFAGTFDSGHGLSLLQSRFKKLGRDTTLWTMELEFHSRGFFRLLAPLMNFMVRKRMRADCARFKATLEAGQLST